MSSVGLPEMAYPSFASPIARFAPSIAPDAYKSNVRHIRFGAAGRLASGEMRWQSSEVVETVIRLVYSGLTRSELDEFMNQSGSGFFDRACDESFEYKDEAGEIAQVRFRQNAPIISAVAENNLYELAPIELIKIAPVSSQAAR